MQNVKENTENKTETFKKAFLELSMVTTTTRNYQIEIGLKDAEHREQVNLLEQHREFIEQRKTIQSFFHGEQVNVKFMEQFYSMTISHAKVDKLGGEEGLMMQCMFELMARL